MTIEFRLPPLPNTDEVSISRWLKEAGDPIQLNQALLQVYSNRFDWDIPAASAGTLGEIRAPAGARVRPGDVLAVLADASAGNERATSEHAPSQAEARISPIAARIADEHGLDLAQVQGSGSHGRITKEDVLALVERQTASPGVETQACESLVETTPDWRLRAEWLSRRRQAVPHVSSIVVVDMGHIRSQIERQQQAWLAREGFALQELSYIVLAAVAALQAVPSPPKGSCAKVPATSRCLERASSPTPKHTTWSASRGAFTTWRGQSRRRQPLRLTREARNRVHYADGQAALLGIGAVQACAVVVDERLVVRPVVYLSLTYDHRLVDGIVAGQFLSFLKARLESNSIQGV
ncbi:MAG: hypothetical protein E6J26_09555 [Chloroflexi bacterium]|nr:MAG: hypothetical protein E6J26_09555 [Chloroflexota bacterium]